MKDQGFDSFYQFKEYLRGACSLRDLLRNYVQLPDSGNVKILCPFHQEHTPSFALHPSGEFFTCFGACGRSFDVFDIIQHFEHTDFRGAVKFLAERENIPLPGYFGKEKEEILKQVKQKEGNVRLLEKLLKILESGRTGDDIDYLLKRGISNDVQQKYRIAGCDLTQDQVTSKLVENGFTYEDIASSNITNDSRFFQSSIIIPVFMRGKIVNLCSRTISDRDPKYLYLKDYQKGLFNYDEAVLSEEIVLSEAPIDALSLISQKFTGVISLGGCSASNEQIITLKKLASKKLFICFDNDADKTENPGKRSAIELAKKLDSKVIILPSPAGKKVDINDFFISGHNLDEFLSIKKNSQDVSELMVKSLPPDTSKIQLRQNLKDVFEYLVGINELDALNIIRHVIAPHFGLSSKEQNDYVRYLKRLFKDKAKKEKEVSAVKSEQEEQPEIITPEDIKTVDEILQSPTLLYDILSFIKKLGVTGEERNSLIHYCTLTSRILDDPLSETVKGESSAGKSYVILKVLQMFPENSYKDITDATAQSFYHVPKDYFQHKIIIIFESHGGEKADYSIRSLQSEKKLKLQITTKDQKTGQFITQEKEVSGPAGFITTTTAARIHDENETRNISIFPDETSEQTLRTFEVTDSKYRGDHPVSKEEIKKWKIMQKLLKPYPVLIPYVEEIRKKFPVKPIRVRRDYGKLLAFIAIITILHQQQREKVIVGEKKEYLKASLADYHLAKIILEDTLSKTINELPPKSEEFIQKAKELIERNGGSGVTIKDLSLELGWDYDTAKKWSEPPFQKGLLTVIEEHKGSRAAKYLVSLEKLEYRVILPPSEKLYEINPDWLGKTILYDPLTGEELTPENDNSTDVPMTKAEEKNITTVDPEKKEEEEVS